MNKINLKKVQKARDILDVSGIAHIVWREHYAGIISNSQIEYMLEKFQSPAGIDSALSEGYEYFLLQRLGINAGYTGIKKNEPDGKMFLSKIYMLSEYRGKGLAYDAICQLEQMCKSQHLSSIWLTVNKQNPSIEQYKKMGFEIVNNINANIGNGFVMEDYIMEKTVL